MSIGATANEYRCCLSRGASQRNRRRWGCHKQVWIILATFIGGRRGTAQVREVERDIPAVGSFEREELRAAAAKSNEVLHQLGPDIQWIESYVADNKTFCVYLAKDAKIIQQAR